MAGTTRGFDLAASCNFDREDGNINKSFTEVIHD